MNKFQTINLDDKDLDKSIYRIIPFFRLVEMFEKSRITLLAPKKWDDPFENILYRMARNPQKVDLRESNRELCFGQCWTFASVSDALWRIYSTDKASVRIRTTLRKLAQSLADGVPKESKQRCFLGKVKYYPESTLKQKARIFTRSLYERNGRRAADSLLFKRKAFSHEREVRLIYFDRDHNTDGDLAHFNISPHYLIDTVLVDPRANTEILGVYRHFLKTKIGFKGNVSRSSLYQIPKELKEELNG